MSRYVVLRGNADLALARGNAVPSGSRVRSLWEPDLVRVPEGRSAYGTGPVVDDVLSAGIAPGGFAGRKPEAWTHWVLAMLGSVQEKCVDYIDELFAAEPLSWSGEAASRRNLVGI